MEGRTAADVVEEMLAFAPIEPTYPELGTNDDYSLVRRWWVEQMVSDDAGLQERMVWFWHTHLTSSLDKVEPALMLRQHKVLRAHAMGNFRELMQQITIDAAMLYWLDGDSNTIASPNENFGREVMELFTLGRDSGAYTQEDVRSAASAFAGWHVDGDKGNEVSFDPEAGLTSTVSLVGSAVSNAEQAINALCDHPACAPFITQKLHNYLVGHDAQADRLASLAKIFVDGGLEIRVLVEAIVRDESFLSAELSRPRGGLEWFAALSRFYNTTIDLYVLDGLGQMPMTPPNVAGWPGPDRWISVSAVFQKANVAWDYAGDLATLDSADPVNEVLGKAGLYAVSDETRASLEAAAQSIEGLRERSTVLHALAACCPEFSLV